MRGDVKDEGNFATGERRCRVIRILPSVGQVIALVFAESLHGFILIVLLLGPRLPTARQQASHSTVLFVLVWQ